jgi:hypothetical protein
MNTVWLRVLLPIHRHYLSEHVNKHVALASVIAPTSHTKRVRLERRSIRDSVI